MHNIKIFNSIAAVARAAFATRLRFRFISFSTMTETVAETVKDVPEEKWETLIEGKAKILHRPGEAFYNPAQVAHERPILLSFCCSKRKRFISYDVNANFLDSIFFVGF